MAARRFCSSLRARAALTSLVCAFLSSDIGVVDGEEFDIDMGIVAADGCLMPGDDESTRTLLVPFPPAIITAASTRPSIFLLPEPEAVDGLDCMSMAID